MKTNTTLGSLVLSLLTIGINLSAQFPPPFPAPFPQDPMGMAQSNVVLPPAPPGMRWTTNLWVTNFVCQTNLLLLRGLEPIPPLATYYGFSSDGTLFCFGMYDSDWQFNQSMFGANRDPSFCNHWNNVFCTTNPMPSDIRMVWQFQPGFHNRTLVERPTWWTNMGGSTTPK